MQKNTKKQKQERQDKIACLSEAMVVSERDSGEPFMHFSDKVPQSLRDIFLEHYNIEDLDYEIFNTALNVVADCYNNNEQDGLNFVQDMIYERSSGQASVYISTRLSYLNIHNEDDISQILAEGITQSIHEACAEWYDRQVTEASLLINQWINEN